MALFDVNGLIGKATQRMAAAPVFAQVAPLVVPPLDRTLHRLTGGRFIVGRLLVPSLVLTTTQATVSFQGRTTEVVARQLSDEDRAEVWPRLVAVWPLYDAYEDRAGRGLRVFHLTPVPTR